MDHLRILYQWIFGCRELVAMVHFGLFGEVYFMASWNCNAGIRKKEIASSSWGGDSCAPRGASWHGLHILGIEGAAIAFFILYMIHSVMVYAVARHLIGFSWSHARRKLLLIIVLFVAMNFISVRLMPLWLGSIFGTVVTFVISIYYLRALVKSVGQQHRLTLRIPAMRLIHNWQQIVN